MTETGWIEVIKIVGIGGAILWIMGRLMYKQEIAKNALVRDMLKQAAEREDKVIGFVDRLSTGYQSCTDTVEKAAQGMEKLTDLIIKKIGG